MVNTNLLLKAGLCLASSDPPPMLGCGSSWNVTEQEENIHCHGEIPAHVWNLQISQGKR